MTCLGGEYHLVDNQLCLTRMLFKICTECVADSSLHRAHNLTVAELGLGLTLKLRLHDFHRHDRCQSFAEVIAGNLHAFELVEHLAVLGIFLQCKCKTAAETGKVRTALYSVDIVDK